jgi:hypothetical protein
MGVVKEIGTAMKKMVVKTPTVDDLAAAVSKADRAAVEAGKVVVRAKNELIDQFDTLADDNDEVGIHRLRDAIAQAERLERDAQANLAQHRGRFERAKQHEAGAGHRQLRVEVDKTGQLLYQRAQIISGCAEALAEALEEYFIVGQEMQRKSDELLVSARQRAGNDRSMPTAVYAVDYPPLFGFKGDIPHMVALDVYVLTQGKWPHKNVGMDLYALSQGPRFDQRVREYMQMLLRTLPDRPDSVPPPVAA